MSPFSFLIQTNSVQSIFSPDPLNESVFFLYHEFSSTFLHITLLFISELTPDTISHHSLTSASLLCLRKWKSLVGLFFFFLRGCRTFPSPFICPDVISAMGSQLLMKSPSVLWTVAWSWVKGFWPLVSSFL